MLPDQITEAVLELPVEDRLELARKLVESVVSPASISAEVIEGMRRIQDIAEGRTVALTEQQFRAALQ